MVADGQEDLDKASNKPPDLVLLDLSMPVMDGIEALTRLREWYDGPIVIFSANDEEKQKVRALDLGADDYLTKPFGLDELAARVRSAIRRTQRLSAPERAQEAVVEMGDVRIDLAKRTLVRASEKVPLIRNEYELLRCLAANAGKIMTHRQLLQEVWGP